MKEDQRSRLSKKILKDTFLELVKQKSFYDINVKELCDRAGINRSTFYRHYDNTADILEEIFTDIAEIIRKTNANAGNDPDHAGDYIYSAIAFFDQHHEYDALLLNGQIPSDFLWKRFGGSIIRSLEKTPVNENDRIALSRFLIGGTFAIISDWTKEGRKRSAKEIADLIYLLSIGSVEKLSRDHSSRQ